MIPTMILFGLVLGRWWRLTLLAAAVVWPALLVMDDVVGLSVHLLPAAFFGAVNAAVGAAVHQAILWLLRRVPSSVGWRRER